MSDVSDAENLSSVCKPFGTGRLNREPLSLPTGTRRAGETGSAALIARSASVNQAAARKASPLNVAVETHTGVAVVRGRCPTR